MTYVFTIYDDMFKKICDDAFGWSRSISEAFPPHVDMLPEISHNMTCDDINSSQGSVKDSIELGLSTEMTSC